MAQDILFYIDTLDHLEKTYSDLFSELKKETTYNPYCFSNSYYEIFKKIVLSLLIGEEVILLDTDFSNEEVNKLLGNSILITNASKSISPLLKLDYDCFNKLIYQHKNTWKITLFTSGTTGLPKKVSHSLDSITRFIKKNIRHTNDIWGFAYNPTHMAGLQVFFQALLNMNTMVRLFGLKRDVILSCIQEYNITNISATPTFYRLLLPSDRVCNSISRITSGGEKFDEYTLNQLATMFPKAKITNIYASTEAGSLFASSDNNFTINEALIDLVKVDSGQLFLHRSLMGKLEGITFDGDWYDTGDLVDVIEDYPLTLRFISRKNDIINVGGYKVNPSEVEDAIRKMKGIKDVFVYGKKNSLLGNIVCCDVVIENDDITEPKLREYLKTLLQEFKIPRIVKFVDDLQKTRTGKISRGKGENNINIHD